MALFGEMEQWVTDRFPGSTWHRDVYFLEVKSETCAALNHGTLQPLVDDLTQGRAWVVVMGTGAEPFPSPNGWDTKVVFYSPDYHALEEHVMWATELHSQSFDQAELENQLFEPTLLAIIAPDRDLILHSNIREIYAKETSVIQEMRGSYPLSFRD